MPGFAFIPKTAKARDASCKASRITSVKRAWDRSAKAAMRKARSRRAAASHRRGALPRFSAAGRKRHPGMRVPRIRPRKQQKDTSHLGNLILTVRQANSHFAPSRSHEHLQRFLGLLTVDSARCGEI